ncbi:hypothetical protein LCGC14_1988460, partial [marine sediment metagenome]
MTQKVLKVGSSAAVTIPKKSLDELGLSIGDKVIVEVDRRTRSVSIKPYKKPSKRQQKIAKLTLDFIERYRDDLEVLAR